MATRNMTCVAHMCGLRCISVEQHRAGGYETGLGLSTLTGSSGSIHEGVALEAEIREVRGTSRLERW